MDSPLNTAIFLHGVSSLRDSLNPADTEDMKILLPLLLDEDQEEATAALRAAIEVASGVKTTVVPIDETLTNFKQSTAKSEA